VHKVALKVQQSNQPVGKVDKANIKRKSVEICLHWFEPDDIGIISGLVHVEFQSLFRYYKTFTT
jgi:hypothetical protein